MQTGIITLAQIWNPCQTPLSLVGLGLKMCLRYLNCLAIPELSFCLSLAVILVAETAFTYLLLQVHISNQKTVTVSPSQLFLSCPSLCCNCAARATSISLAPACDFSSCWFVSCFGSVGEPCSQCQPTICHSNLNLYQTPKGDAKACQIKSFRWVC